MENHNKNYTFTHRQRNIDDDIVILVQECVDAGRDVRNRHQILLAQLHNQLGEGDAVLSLLLKGADDQVLHRNKERVS